jgi:hypothetical protein
MYLKFPVTVKCMLGVDRIFSFIVFDNQLYEVIFSKVIRISTGIAEPQGAALYLLLEQEPHQNVNFALCKPMEKSRSRSRIKIMRLRNTEKKCHRLSCFNTICFLAFQIYSIQYRYCTYVYLYRRRAIFLIFFNIVLLDITVCSLSSWS